MGAITPRWEWRTFGNEHGSAERAILAEAASEAAESDELYLLGSDRAGVKLRDDLVDVKVLRDVNADGVERWEPVMKAGFPLSGEDVARVSDAFGLPPAPRSTAASIDELVGELGSSGLELRSISVHKRRTRATFHGCMAEVADLSVDGRSTRTVAIESEDSSAVAASVRAAGLEDYVNTSYPRGLAAIADGEPPRYAVIDVGTNSIKFHVAERAPAEGFRDLIDRAEVTRLGEGLDRTGRISDEAQRRTAEAIAAMVEEARTRHARAIVAVGTAGLRIAENGAAVVDAIRERAGVTVHVISGEEESRLAYLAVTAGLGLPEGPVVVFDTGGGSSQFTFGHGQHVEERFSVDVGAVRYTERFGLDGAVGPDTVREAMAAIAADLSRLDGHSPPDALVGMGGGITNITAVMLGLAEYDADRVQGAVLDGDEVDRQIELYASRDAEDRRSIVGLQPKRAEVILAGACIVRTVMDKLGRREVRVSDRGLRHGVLIERFGEAQ
jgi:exopolyphosphatase / guanosine-5'-triphosphate,3'-diphosphate pyrophosphatase